MVKVKNNMKEKIVLIGAGSAMFTKGLIIDFIRLGINNIEIALVDIDPIALNMALKLSQKIIDAAKSQIKLTSSADVRKALPGATVVICTIGVGGRRAWEQDVLIPRKFGIYQPVGDSVMPGGASRALRMIPAIVKIAKDVLELCPHALFFNYANPMAPICRAVRKSTGANMVGLCHGVFHTGNSLASLLGVKNSNLYYTAIGMNHLTWFVEIKVEKKNAIPKLHTILDKFLGKIDCKNLGKKFGESGTIKRGEVELENNPFCWQLFKLFGVYPGVNDRHVTEFFPHLFSGKGEYYGKTLGIDAYSFENTISYGDKIFDEMCEIAFSKKPLPVHFLEKISGEHEQVTEIILSIRQNKSKIFSANLPNEGQIPNFPKDVIVESPAITTNNGLKSIRQKPLPTGIVGTLATRFSWVETITEAALEGSRDKFVQALLLDGAVSSIDVAYKLADELLQAQAEFLPQFKLTSKGKIVID